MKEVQTPQQNEIINDSTNTNNNNNNSPDSINELPFSEQFKLSFKNIRTDREKQIKLGIIGLVIILICLDSNLGIFSFVPMDEKCFTDRLIEWSRPVHNFYKENVVFRNAFTLISSLCLDIIMLYGSLRWVFFEETWRIGVATLAFYGVRAMVQSLYVMRFSDEYLFESPPFISIVVSYRKTNDYFFSGHVGFPILVAQEFFMINQPVIGCFCLFVSCMEEFLVCVARTHYSIDIFTGIFFAHYVLIIVDYWEKLVKATIKEMEKKKEISTQNTQVELINQ